MTDRLTGLLASASVEVSSSGNQLGELTGHFAAGTDVSITFLPGDNYRHNVETAVALRAAGFNPVPHIAAREIASREALDDVLGRARGEADVRRVVLVAGDVAAAKGPFKSSRDVAASGLIEGHGIGSVSVGGYPEGHPWLEGAHEFEALAAWREWGGRSGVGVDIVTQFCFESAPILVWLGELRARGIELPVTIGLAGPATLATLTKFGLRCGIGNSMRALRGQIGRFGRGAVGPPPPAATAAISGFHLFPFGGLRKAAAWLGEFEHEQQAAPRTVPQNAAQNP
jgi:methylenetetrahydrofolate reductase (NADPH)